MDHPIAPESLERFLRGATSREENRRILAHLLAGCAACAEHVARRREPAPDAYDAALDRFEEAFREAQAPDKLDFLRHLLPPGGELRSPARRAPFALSKL